MRRRNKIPGVTARTLKGGCQILREGMQKMNLGYIYVDWAWVYLEAFLNLSIYAYMARQLEVRWCKLSGPVYRGNVRSDGLGRDAFPSSISVRKITTGKFFCQVSMGAFRRSSGHYRCCSRNRCQHFSASRDYIRSFKRERASSINFTTSCVLFSYSLNIV